MIKNETISNTLDKISLELRRGVLVLATLSQLKEEKYGYDLISHLTGQGLEIDQGTLYPLLRRLESQGLLDSTWNTDGSRPRKYYILNAAGEAILSELSNEWRSITEVMEGLLGNNSQFEEKNHGTH